MTEFLKVLARFEASSRGRDLPIRTGAHVAHAEDWFVDLEPAQVRDGWCLLLSRIQMDFGLAEL